MPLTLSLGLSPGRNSASRPICSATVMPASHNVWSSVVVSPLSAPCSVTRSEEHTSELQSLRHLVCRLLLEKNKKQLKIHNCSTTTTPYTSVQPLSAML